MLISVPRAASLAVQSTITLRREPQQTAETVTQCSHCLSSNILSNKHNMSDFEDLGIGDGEL